MVDKRTAVLVKHIKENHQGQARITEVFLTKLEAEALRNFHRHQGTGTGVSGVYTRTNASVHKKGTRIFADGRTARKQIRKLSTEVTAAQPQASSSARRNAPSAGHSLTSTSTSSSELKKARWRPYPQSISTLSYKGSSRSDNEFLGGARDVETGTTSPLLPPLEEGWVLTEASTHPSSTPYYPGLYETTGTSKTPSSSRPLEDVPSRELIDEEWCQFLDTYLEIPDMIEFTPTPAPTDLSCGISEEELEKKWDQSTPRWSIPFPSPSYSTNPDIRHIPSGIFPLPKCLWQSC